MNNEFEEVVRSILIFSGKFYPQGTSFADGFLHFGSLDELKILPAHEEFSGHILFEHRDNELHRITVDGNRGQYFYFEKYKNTRRSNMK